MYDFEKPNYKENNIINLMSSISNNFGKKHKYNELKALDSRELSKYDNIVLIVIDGLGYNYLKTQKDSFLYKHLKTKLSTTFLAATTCANTAFQVGYPPQQHGLTGWTMYLKETKSIVKILPFTNYDNDEQVSENNLIIDNILEIESYHKDFKSDCYTIIEKEKSKRKFINYVASNTKIIPTETDIHVLPELKDLINQKSKNRRYIHAYLDEFDSIQHISGVGTPKTNLFFETIDNQIRELSKNIKNTKTKLIITSDHGMIDYDKDSQIFIENIVGLEECLSIPITGEPRVRNCYVKPNKVDKFLKIVKNKLSKYCWCIKGEDIINDNFYGLGTPNPKLFDRVGDYILIMRDNYVLFDSTSNIQKATHGAFNEDERFVPLVTLDL
ncbi:MAG: alkaline phosphatase family protein [Nanoarchaeales archaeon]|nr:alkaline phosphatase family protein [Nanoarchaeales archaeon]